MFIRSFRRLSMTRHMLNWSYKALRNHTHSLRILIAVCLINIFNNNFRQRETSGIWTIRYLLHKKHLITSYRHSNLGEYIQQMQNQFPFVWASELLLQSVMYCKVEIAFSNWRYKDIKRILTLTLFVKKNTTVCQVFVSNNKVKGG